MSGTSEERFIEQYVRLCASPLRGEAEIVNEYEALKHHPRVTGLSFYRPDVLMVGTDEIIIEYQQQKYYIGDFIIFLVRRQVGGYWDTDFRFWNVTCPLCHKRQGAVMEGFYIHPHIIQATDELLDCDNGELCISRGQFTIYQHLRKGEMHRAADRLIEVLEVYPTGKAYQEPYYWPKWEEDHA